MDSIKINQIRIVRLAGSRTERARDHGRILAGLTKAELETLAYTPLSKKNQKLLKRACDGIMPFLGNPLGQLIGRIYEAFVLERFLRLSRYHRKRLAPFAEASTLSLKKIWLSLYQPDFLMFLAASAKPSVRNRFLQGMPGCSSTTIRAGEDLYFLRNLDYPAASYWEKNQTVFYHEPSEPEYQNYVSISSLGVDTAGLTGCNESGIGVSLHAHFSKKFSLRGTPIFFLLEEILERAHTTEDAIHICRNFKTIGSWAINLTHSKEKRAMTLELVQGSVFIRESELNCGIAHSNHFQSPDFKKNEIHFSGAFFEDCESRKASLEKSMNALATDFSWPKALATLGNHVDPTTGEARVFGNTVNVVTTIQSVGFDFKEQCFYLSTKTETPTGQGPYLKLPFRFKDIDLARAPELLTVESNPGAQFDRASHAYHLAYVAWQVRDEEAPVVHAHLVQACEAVPTDPHLQLQRGYFALINAQFQEGLQCFETALELKLSPHLEQVALYFRGACFDLLGNRERALLDYQKILAFQKVDENLGEKAQKRLKKPYQASYCKRIEPDLQFAEPIDYL